MDTHSSTSDGTDPVEFYLPGTFQFGHGPGRIERFLRRVSGSHDAVDQTIAGSDGPGFYLPATPDVRPTKSR